MDAQAVENLYDEVPYPSYPYVQSHPDRLATVATLLGLSPAPVNNCRVLEVGCASGGNIIPMGCALPQSKFVGIDYSARQIEQGQKTVAAMGLENVTLRHLDILAAGPDLGQFDYIIAHGIYSWVPPEVREKLLALCRQNLAANGVAYISYNVYPGWGLIGLVRDMMLYRTRNITDPRERLAQSRELLNFLSESVSEGSVYGDFIKAYNAYRVQEKPEAVDSESFLLHDELEEVNDPVYFFQFAQQVEQHGLQYVGDAVFSSMFANKYPEEVGNTLNQMSRSVTDFEQYLDFLANRTFRQSLLCHQGISLTRRLTPQHLINFHISSSAMPVAQTPNIKSVSVEKFIASNKATFSTDHPVTKAAMIYLSKMWPRAVSFRALLSQACALLDPQAKPTQDDAQGLATNLLIAYSYNSQLVDLHSHAPQFVTKISQRPLASPLARLQVKQGLPKITNLRHERVTMQALTRHILYHLDGHHTRQDLVALLEELVAEGKLNLQEAADEDGAQTETPRDELAQVLDKRLSQLAHSALLEA